MSTQEEEEEGEEEETLTEKSPKAWSGTLRLSKIQEKEKHFEFR